MPAIAIVYTNDDTMINRTDNLWWLMVETHRFQRACHSIAKLMKQFTGRSNKPSLWEQHLPLQRLWSLGWNPPLCQAKN